jgi:nitrate reductase NapE component
MPSEFAARVAKRLFASHDDPPRICQRFNTRRTVPHHKARHPNHSHGAYGLHIGQDGLYGDLCRLIEVSARKGLVATGWPGVGSVGNWHERRIFTDGSWAPTHLNRVCRMQEKELDDIKRTLQRIQRIASEPIDDTLVDDIVSPELAEHRTSEPRSETVEPVVHDNLRSQRLTVFAIAALAVVGATGAAVWMMPKTSMEPGSTSETTSALSTEPQRPTVQAPQDAPAAITGDAQTLLEAGRVVEARKALVDLPVKSPEAALTLARSYDPNYLRQIPNPNAAADPTEAERWYRTWRDIASERGLVLEPDRFDRIIKAMR